MKLASWVYADLEQMQQPRQRRPLIDRMETAGLDIALCVWRAADAIDHADTIGKLATEMAQRGIELHVGICPFAPPPRTVKRRLYQYKVDGKLQYGNLCPSWPENRKQVIRTVERLCEHMPVEGLHLDFIRYLFSAGVPWKLEWEAGREWIDTYHWCTCEMCQQEREPWLNRGEITTYDRMHPGVVFKELEFRKRNVNEVIHGIRDAVQRHGKTLSIAQRVQYLNRAILEGQDWIEWAQAGLYQFVCPMNYSTHTETFRERVTQNMPRLANRAPGVKVYEGVSRKSSAGESSIDTVLEQMGTALELGADGVTLFHLGVLAEGEERTLGEWKRSVG